MDWPSLQGQEIAQLKASFKNPQHLEAAFDDDEGARELLRLLLPGIAPEGLEARTQILVKWRDQCQRPSKVLRRDSFIGMMEQLSSRMGRVPTLQETYASEARMNPLVLLPGLERRRKALRTDRDASQRAEHERLAREKYTALLADVIKEAQLPLVAILSEVDDPESAWKRIFGNRRSKTLRNRYRSWRAFEKWLTVIYGKTWPTSIAQLLAYINQRVEEGCGKTVLGSFQAALSVLEITGRVDEGSMLSRDKTWLAQLSSLTTEVVSQSPPVKQAPMYTVATVVALECYVASEAPAYARALAWVALLMVYCSLRADDVQGIRPETMQLTSAGFRAKLGRTKTTGPDRRVKEVQIFVHRRAGLSGNDWLKVGFELWDKISQRRDFLVLEADRDWSKPTTRGVDAASVSLYVSSVLQQLGTPKLEEGVYRMNRQRPLMAEEAHRFFRGHSPRNFLTSVAAAIGVPRDDRDFLGRWLIAREKGSAEYTRTARTIVHRIQEEVCRAILSPDGATYNEEEILEELKAYIDEQGSSGALTRRRHDIMKRPDGGRHLSLRWPPFEVDVGESDDEIEEAGADPPQDADCKYFIAVSKKSGHRRLHLNGPCHVKPYLCSSVSFVNEVSLDDIDSICRDCKHRMRKDQDQDVVGESTSDSSSSSS